MFEYEKIAEMQQYGKQTIRFDPDSSPAAWKHYKQIYQRNKYLSTHYDFQKLSFYSYYDKAGLKRGHYINGTGWLNYINEPFNSPSAYNRLYVLEKGTITVQSNNNEYIAAANRLGGDCDFNFNEKKCLLFLDIIENDSTASPREKENARQQLSRCRDMHHTLLNFSLMQAIGNMQGFKGSNRFDRFDTFIHELDKYFKGVSNAILESSSTANKSALISFLNDFTDIYEYCATFYFMDKHFVEEIIKQGSLPITNVTELVRYMNLAKKYWERKEFVFLKNEFLAVDDCFKNGGEIYSRNELISKLGYSEEEVTELITKCVDRGFIIDTGNNAYQIKEAERRN